MKTFPMFLQMAGRRVLVIGGGEQAAQKVRLILKTEAEIVVLSDHLCSELQSHCDAGQITHLNEPLNVDLLRSAILTFSATGCAGAGSAHAALAEEANALINVVDMPAHCEAMTPSIVDRDPLVIAIGTEGNAPILGRQIKSKIETTLETQLGDLVAFAGRMRKDVAQFVPQSKRRAFWKTVFDGPPRDAFKAGNTREAFNLIKSMIQATDHSPHSNGEVSIIQSDQGLAGKLRLEDVAKLQEADRIYFQQGLHENILEMARRDAERTAYCVKDQVSPPLKMVRADAENANLRIVIIAANERQHLSRSIH